jgi:hypothetical protein
LAAAAKHILSLDLRFLAPSVGSADECANEAVSVFAEQMM